MLSVGLILAMQPVADGARDDQTDLVIVHRSAVKVGAADGGPFVVDDRNLRVHVDGMISNLFCPPLLPISVRLQTV